MAKEVEMTSLRVAQPKVHELASRKLELTRKIAEMKVELAKINDSLLKDGSPSALVVIACW